jgi:hypothetical protein
MKGHQKALLIAAALAIALLVGGYASQTSAPAIPPTIADEQTDCVVDEQSDCAERCQTEYNCCIKSCNWVERKARSGCIKHCKSTLEHCNRQCDEKPPAGDPIEAGEATR